MRKKQPRFILKSCDRSSFRESLVAYFDKGKIVWKISCIFPCFSLIQTELYSESYTTLLGSLVRHVDVGSGLNITCAVINYPLKLEYIIFYHNNKVSIVMINTKATIILSKTNMKNNHIVQTENNLIWVSNFSKLMERGADLIECKFSDKTKYNL